MIEREEHTSKYYTTKAITCDLCKVRYTDPMDLQEFVTVSKVTGYTSKFGDQKILDLDICDACLYSGFNQVIQVRQYGSEDEGYS